MLLHFLFIFIITFILTVILTFFIRRFAIKLNVVDVPANKVRKIHKHPIPLLGGLAIYFAFFGVFFLYYKIFDNFYNINLNQFLGVFISASILMIGGFIDDKFDIGVYSFIFPLIAVINVLFFNIEIKEITNPFGGVYNLKKVNLGNFIIDVSRILTFLWLLGMSYTTKLLDGLDGLVSGITAIGGFVIFLLSTTTKYYQPDVAIVALILTAACLGFLVFNFHPAKIFIGEGGSVFTGFILGVLSIIAGSKIATALLVMGIPILDIVWVIFRRIKSGQSIFKYDNLHLHHRLLSIGLTQRQVVLIFYFLSLSFGLTTLFLQSLQKIFALFLLSMIMLCLGIFLVYKQKKYGTRTN